ncbi:MAG: YtxH domain-containing protein [Candidatus Roizmanbacteria bacterium]|nr:YtxH domain-containing protein [Candidatus Roizmanbacteria bacterium]
MNVSSSEHQGFVTGFGVGAVVGACAAYLLVTSSGRKILRNVMDVAQDIADKGDEYLHLDDNKPHKTENITGIIDKLKKSVK